MNSFSKIQKKKFSLYLLAIIGALLLLTLTFTPSYGTVDNDWPEYRHDTQHAGFSNANFPETGGLIWDFKPDDVITSSPVVSKGKVYFSSHDGSLYSINAETGEKLWSRSIGEWGGFRFPNTGIGNRLMSTPAVAEDKVYVGSWDGFIYCFDADSGERIWKHGSEAYNTYYTHNFDKITSFYEDFGPSAGGNLLQIIFFSLFLISTIGFIYRRYSGFLLDKKNIVIICLSITFIALTVLPMFQPLFKRADRFRVDSSPNVENGTVYVGSRDNNLYALDSSTGEKIWSFKANDVVTSSPAIGKNKVFFGSRDDNIYSLNAETGELIWSYETNDLVHSSPTIDNETVYCGSRDGWFYALNQKNGRVKWRRKAPEFKTMNHINSSPAVGYGLVFFTSYNRNIYAVDKKTGEMRWNYKTNGPCGYSSPAVAENKIIVGSYGGTYNAFKAKTGEKTWSFEVQGMFIGNQYAIASPAIYENKVYVTSSPFESNIEKGKEKGYISRLYALGSPKIKVHNIETEPDKVKPNEEVTITLKTENPTNIEGHHTIRLIINSNALKQPTIKTKQSHYGPQEEKTVKVKVKYAVPVSYIITSPNGTNTRGRFEVQTK